MNIPQIVDKKSKNEKISMITCYDYWSAKIINDSPVDLILVGDSLSMIMHGHPTTLNATMEIMCLHTLAVSKGAPKKIIVGDMPFMSYRKSLSENMTNVESLMKAGSHAIKLEGAIGNIDLIKHIVDSGVPVMGHLGLTPQSVHTLGGFKVQGKEERSAQIIFDQAKQLEQAGCFSIVLECVPSELSKKITQNLVIPTIGIGAGPFVDGQVLVLQDMLGMNKDFKPKFLKQYLNGHSQIQSALNQFHKEVISGEYPTMNESY